MFGNSLRILLRVPVRVSGEPYYIYRFYKRFRVTITWEVQPGLIYKR